MKQALAFTVMLVMLAACGDRGTRRFQGTPPPEAEAFGECAFCHRNIAVELLPSAAELACTTCHADARPGHVGPGHRLRPPASLVPSFPATGHKLAELAPYGSCAYCHNSTTVALRASAADLRCEQCHTVALGQGYAPGHRSIPSAALVPSAPSDPHRTGPLAPWGTCSLCHARAAASLAEQFGPTTTTSCLTCHDEQAGRPFGPSHASLPGPTRVPSAAASPHRPATEASWGDCSLCHNQEARLLESLLGPPDQVSCLTCHTAGPVAQFGPHHRLRPESNLVPDPPPTPHAPAEAASFGDCALCHRSLALAVAPVAMALSCQVCHSSTTPGSFGPGHRGLPDPSLVPAFLGSSHELGDRAIFGSCAFCHRDKADAVLSSGAGSLGCVLCHDLELGPFGPNHRSIPSAEEVPSFIGTQHDDPALRPFGTCGFCHRSQVEQALRFTHGDLSLECSRCHPTEEATGYGEGHAGVPACASCHGTERRTHHDPAAGTVSECSVCHDPHGSDNLSLIARSLRTPSGLRVPIRFDRLAGLADGGLANPTTPGSGLCEVCHAETRFYRADGSGAPHFAFPCFTCHPHGLGFSLRP